ncbi:hypothetical protein [Halobacterium sp. KA-6]|uniref:hypothetical protein n=1 Tax=Halobacterium sp. KA-6 TaxID=2896368 RepID=UPI001E2889CC|nr:hypothetical protein [Halobacterium sp. KA-6]MCD2205322.1 hypothetical protein [Halobacterium sp. KA-6]
MTDRVLLTEQRENVLNGEYDGSDAALRNQKSRLRKSSQTALQELTQVAESQHIDHTDVFDPDDVFRLLRALLTPVYPDHYADHEDFGGLTHEKDMTDEWNAYASRLQVQLAKLVLEEPDADE